MIYAMAKCPRCGRWLQVFDSLPGFMVVGCLNCQVWSRESKDVERAVGAFREMLK